MSLGLNGVRTQIKNTLSGVTGITGGGAMVHDYLRWTEGEADVKADFVTAGGQLHTWMISLNLSDFYRTQRYPSNHEQSVYAFDVSGLLASKDSAATEKPFAGNVDSVFRAFRADRKLGNTVIESGPLVGAEGGYRLFCGVLCHFVRLVLTVREQTEP